MLKFRDHRCQTCLKITERMMRDNIKNILCECGGVATRILSAPKCFQNTTGRSPSASNIKVK